MALEVPNLDDRRFQELLDEARRLIPHYCPRWTDHNLSDPGITLLELFAGLVESMIYRLNRVPEKSYLTFLNLMGVRRLPPVAARAEITFWLAAPLSEPSAEPKLIPARTEVANDKSAAEQVITFSTDSAVLVRPPTLVACLTSDNEQRFVSHPDCIKGGGDAFPVFSNRLVPDHDAFYLVDKNDLSGHILALTIAAQKKGRGVKPDDPPLEWQAWCGNGWQRAEQESDSTGGLNQIGEVVLHLPQNMARRAQTDVAGATHEGYWLRCRLIPAKEGQPSYDKPPEITAIAAATWGASAPATHAISVFGEELGRSSGLPGQSFYLEYKPVLEPRQEGETIEVQDGAEWLAWQERLTFAESLPKDTHYTLDSFTGEVCFGPLIREPDGRERQYGAIPPAGALIRFRRYRTGGGSAGNVGKHTLSVLRSAPSYIDRNRVANRAGARYGSDAESLDHLRLRAPQELSTGKQAITARDYERLVVASQTGFQRAMCVQPGRIGNGENPDAGPPPGEVRLLVVPSVEREDGRLSRDDLAVDEQHKRALANYLDDRRLLATRVTITTPTYVGVRAVARVKCRPDADAGLVVAEAQRRLNRFLSPLTGGPDAQGWPFGRDLYISEVYAVLQGTPGVEYILDLQLQESSKPGVQGQISLPPDGLLLSDDHQITHA